MNKKEEIINHILTMESHELDVLVVLMKITKTLSPEFYSVIGEPVKELIIDTIHHIEDLHNLVDDYRGG